MSKEALRIATALLMRWNLLAGRWPATVEAVQRILKHSPVKRLEKNGLGKIQCPLKVLTGLKPSAILIRLSPLRHFHDLKIIDQERCNRLIDIEGMHNAFAQMHKYKSENTQHRRTQAQKCTTAR